MESAMFSMVIKCGLQSKLLRSRRNAKNSETVLAVLRDFLHRTSKGEPYHTMNVDVEAQCKTLLSVRMPLPIEIQCIIFILIAAVQ